MRTLSPIASERDKFRSGAADGLAVRMIGAEAASHVHQGFDGTLTLDAEHQWDHRRARLVYAGPGRQLSPHANHFAGRSLLEIASDFIRVSTGENPMGWTGPEIARRVLGPEMPSAGGLGGGAFHTTSSFPNLLLDAANKTLLAAYLEAAGTWRRWVKIGEPAPDFKNIRRVRLGSSGSLDDVPEGKPFPEDELGDSVELYAVQTRGKAFSFTRETLVNDDLGAFKTRIIRMARAAERTINRKVYGLLISNPTMRDGNALFDDTNHGNHVDSGTAPTVAALNSMQQRLRQMVDATRTDESVFLHHSLGWIVGPPEVEGDLLQLLSSTANPASSGNSGINNIWRGRVVPMIEPELNADATLGATAYYGGGNWRDADHLEVSFLRGEETPVIEEDYNFHTKGREFTIHQTFGVKVIDWTNIVKNDGAA